MLQKYYARTLNSCPTPKSVQKTKHRALL